MDGFLFVGVPRTYAYANRLYVADLIDVAACFNESRVTDAFEPQNKLVIDGRIFSCECIKDEILLFRYSLCFNEIECLYKWAGGIHIGTMHMQS